MALVRLSDVRRTLRHYAFIRKGNIVYPVIKDNLRRFTMGGVCGHAHAKTFSCLQEKKEIPIGKKQFKSA